MIKRLLVILKCAPLIGSRWLVSIVIPSILLAPLSAMAEGCVKAFRWTEDPPYTYESAEAPGGVSGISADIIRIVLKNMGCEAKFVEMP